MGIFIFSYHFSNEDKIRQLGDEYAKYHEKIIRMKKSDQEYLEIARNCERIIADLRKVIVRSEVIYKNEQEQLNKSIEVAVKAKEALRRKNNEPEEDVDIASFDPTGIMDEMEENPEVFNEIVNEIDDGYDVDKLKSGYNKVMDLMKEISEDENLRIGMFNIPD